MERFFEPKDRRKFVRWLLEETIRNKWTAVFEHKDNKGYNVLRKSGTLVTLPHSAKHNYLEHYKLTAVVDLRVNDKLVNKIIQNTSVLSIHHQTEMIFLIADDFHHECFSCSPGFYDNYYQVLKAQSLIQST